jgi:hypothetical protein
MKLDETITIVREVSEVLPYGEIGIDRAHLLDTLPLTDLAPHDKHTPSMVAGLREYLLSVRTGNWTRYFQFIPLGRMIHQEK